VLQDLGRWPRDALRAWPRDRPRVAAARPTSVGSAVARGRRQEVPADALIGPNRFVPDL
jgi:hypothetical protein